MTTVPPPICSYCQHFQRPWRCTAFSDRIPQEIIDSDHDHRQPYPGDHGIRFDPIDDDAAATVAAMFEEGAI